MPERRLEEVPLALRPDLTSVFDELPGALATLKNEENVSVELDFFEQGTEVGVWMHRIGDKIHIRFETCPGSGEQYQSLSEKEFPVSAHQFFQQWRAFLKAILAAIAEARPEATRDASYAQYHEAINNLT